MFKRKNRGVKLTEEQKGIKNLIINKLETGEYKEEFLPCLCGANDDEILAEEDRYGIPFKTVICKHCGLIRSNPYYNEQTLIDFYSKYYRTLYQTEDYSDEQFEKRKRKGSKYINIINSQTGIKISNQKVFEIGCAGGAILQAFKDNGCEVFGCDYGKKYLEFGRAKGLTLEEGSHDTLIQYGKADIIILSHVLEHITNPVKFLNDIKQLLKDDGYLFVALPTIERINLYKNDIFLYLQNAHVYDFSDNTAKYVFEISGYKIDKLLSEQGVFICKKSDNYREISDVDKQEYKNAQKQLKHFEFNYHYKKITDKIFSIHNYYKNDVKHKKITIFGIKLTFKVKNNK